jgi:hypothetical protein
MKTIKTANKIYLGRVIGPNAKYGVEVEFLKPTKQPSRSLAYYDVGPGIYKHEPREAECDNRRRDTGFLHITEDGETREITQDQALEIIAAQQDPAEQKRRALVEIRALMAKHGITADELR